MSADIRALRKKIKQHRLSLAPDESSFAAERIAENLWQQPAMQRCKSIGVYLAAFGEVDCDAFIHQAWLRKKRVFAPILRKNALLYAPLQPTSAMQKNRYGILEPVHSLQSLLTPQALDVVLVPLVAFDSAMHRVGMGAGYYDRSFALRLRRRKWRKPRLLGVAYSFQHVARLQPASWDVPMDAVITEQECFGSC